MKILFTLPDFSDRSLDEYLMLYLTYTIVNKFNTNSSRKITYIRKMLAILLVQYLSRWQFETNTFLFPMCPSWNAERDREKRNSWRESRRRVTKVCVYMCVCTRMTACTYSVIGVGENWPYSGGKFVKLTNREPRVATKSGVSLQQTNVAIVTQNHQFRAVFIVSLGAWLKMSFRCLKCHTRSSFLLT